MFPVPSFPSIGLIIMLPVLFLVAFVFYVVLFWKKGRPNSPIADDEQLGIKVVLAVTLMGSFFLALMGLQQVLHFLITFDSSDEIKEGIPAILVGGATSAGIYLKLLPQTNWEKYDQVPRLVVGTVALFGLLMLIVNLNLFISSIFKLDRWVVIASALTNTLVYGAAGLLAVYFFAKFSGLDVDTSALKREIPRPVQAPASQAPLDAKPVDPALQDQALRQRQAQQQAQAQAQQQAQAQAQQQAQAQAQQQAQAQAQQQAQIQQQQYQQNYQQQNSPLGMRQGQGQGQGQGRHGGYLGAPRAKGPEDDDLL